MKILKTWNAEIHAEILDPRGESLVEPEMRPPFHRDQIAEPLMRQLVTNHQSHALFGRHRRVEGIDQQARLSA